MKMVKHIYSDFCGKCGRKEIGGYPFNPHDVETATRADGKRGAVIIMDKRYHEFVRAVLNFEEVLQEKEEEIKQINLLEVEMKQETKAYYEKRDAELAEKLNIENHIFPMGVILSFDDFSLVEEVRKRLLEGE